MTEQTFTIEKLYSAYLKSCKRKGNSLSAMEFTYNLENNLFEILQQLQNKTYKPEQFKCFVVKDPVIREVFCSQFRDRVVQHLLLDEIEHIFEPLFIYDSFACRKNKGTHLAIKRVQQGIQSLEDIYKKPAYYLQLDISGFFMSIDRSLLYQNVEEVLVKKYTKYQKSAQWLFDILWLSKTIIETDPVKNHIKVGDLNLFSQVPLRKSLFSNTREGKGLPIGNLSSQFFANVYLNQLDQYIKRELKCRYYYRYVDDFVILHYDKNYLRQLQFIINDYLQKNLFLQLNLQKTKLQLCEKGIDFLGYIIRKKYILVRKRVVNNLKRKIYLYETKREKIRTAEELLESLKNINNSIRSYFGHFKHANSFRLKQTIIKKIISE
jgi:retron-type reverse transcriptase